MRLIKIYSILTFTFLSNINAFSQKCDDPYIMSNKEVYSSAIEKVYGSKLPTEFLIQAKFAEYPALFMEDKLYLNVKTFLQSNNWKFSSSAGKTAYHNLSFKSVCVVDSVCRKHPELTNDVKPLYLCSPVLVSTDPNKALITFEEVHNGQILNFIVCFVEKKKGHWNVVKLVAPFLY